jgi:hypothetical protein
MIPDILGYKLEKGIELLCKQGISPETIVIREYISPNMVILGNEKRILRASRKKGEIFLIVSNF